MDKTQIGVLSAEFEGLLYARMLEPLAKNLGEMGDIAVRACTLSLARREEIGFGATLAAYLEKDAAAAR